MRWQEVNKKLVAIVGTTGSIGLITLFAYLFTLSGAEYTHTGDSVCNGLECVAYINNTQKTWEVCFEHPSDDQRIYIEEGGKLNRTTIREHPETIIYKKSTRGRTTWVNLNNVDIIIKTEPEIPVDWLVPARGAGNWRPLKDGDCWERGKVNRIKLVGHPSEGQIIKWTFEIISDEINISAEPKWVSYNYIYENLSDEEPVYEYNLIEFESIYNSTNGTWSKAYNYTERNLISYETIYYDGDRLGLKIGDKTINHPNVNVNAEEGYIYECFYPVGKRNWKEFPMRQYEIDKKMCKKTSILELIK